MSTQDKEILFGQTLEQVKKLARSQGGRIDEEQVREAFAECELTEDRLQMVLDYLVSQHIGIGEALEEEEYLTQEEQGYLRFYLEELEQLPDYTDGQKKALTMSAMAGDESAQMELVQVYLRDVTSIAKIYTGQGVLLEDLIGEGNVALTMGTTMLGAQEKPEECEGVLMKMVMDAMEELIKESTDSDETSKKALDRVNLVNDKANALSQELGRKVTVEELVAEEHLSAKAVRDAMRISGFALDGLENDE